VPIRAAPKAAGLNRWRLSIASRYLDAIAQADTRTRKPVAARSPGDGGVMIRTMISALMHTDSQLLLASNTRAKSQLTPKHVDSATRVEKARFIQGWRTMPRTARTRAASTI